MVVLWRALTVVALVAGTWLISPGSVHGDLFPQLIVEHFYSAGIPISDSLIFTEETDPNGLLGRPGQYFSKLSWRDGRAQGIGVSSDRLSVDTGGSVELFRSVADRELRQEYLYGFAELSMISEHTFGHGTVIVRVSQRLTAAQAAEYERALTEIVGE